MPEDFEQPQEQKVDSPSQKSEGGADLGVKVERETTERERVDSREQERQRVEETAGQGIKESVPLDLVRKRTGAGGSQVERMLDGTPSVVTRANGDRREFEYENGALKSVTNFDGSTFSSPNGGRTWVRTGADGSEVRLSGPPSVDKSGNLRYWEAETGARITEYANRVDVHPGQGTSVTPAEVGELRSKVSDVISRLRDDKGVGAGTGAQAEQAAAGMRELLRGGKKPLAEVRGEDGSVRQTFADGKVVTVFPEGDKQGRTRVTEYPPDDPQGRVSQTEYQDKKVSKLKNGRTETEYHEPTSQGVKKEIAYPASDPQGRAFRLQYSQGFHNDNLRAETHSRAKDGLTVEREYGGPNGVTSERDTYNARSRLVTAEREGSRLSYDERGNLMEARAANGQVTRYEYNDKNEVATVDYGSGKWKSEDGKHWVNEKTGKTWDGTVEVDKNTGIYSEKGASGNYSRTMNPDGSQVWKDKNGDVTEIATGKGEKFKLTYEAPGNLTKVEYPDGSAAVKTNDHWQKSVPAREGAAAGAYRLDSVTVGTEGKLIEKLPDGARDVHNSDRSITRYDANCNITAVVRADGHKIDVKRSPDGKITEIADTKGPTVWESRDGETFVRKGSNPPDAVHGKPFTRANGDYGFSSGDKTFERTSDGFKVTDQTQSIQLRDNGTSVIADRMGRPVASEDIKGVVRSVTRDDDGKILGARISDQVWIRSKEPGRENEWTSNTGKRLKGDFEFDKEGNFAFKDADTKFETVNKSDGSVLFRDAQQRVHRIIGSDGQPTDFTYSRDGKDLIGIKMPDGTSYSRLPDKPGGKPPQERWLQDGTSKIVEGTRRIEADGTLRTHNKGEAERVRSSDGWEKRTDASGQVSFARDSKDGSSITKNSLGQITAVTDASGSTRQLGYDSAGNLNGITYADGQKWASTDSGKTWSKEGSTPPKTWEGKLSVTGEGDIVETTISGAVRKESIFKADGSRLWAENGKITDLRTATGQEYKIGYGPDGQPSKFTDAAEKGSYWTSEDGKSWKKYSADGKLDAAAKPEHFSLDVRPDGSISRRYAEAQPPRIDVVGTDGVRTSLYEDGRKMSEMKPERPFGKDGKYSEVSYKYDEAKNFVGKVEKKPDGLVLQKDALDRVTEATRSQVTRRFEYEGNSKLVKAFEENGRKFYLDERERAQGRLIYASGNDKLAGLMGVRPDGAIHMIRGDGSETFTGMDGSMLTKLANGAITVERPDGKLREIVDVNGNRTSFKYDLQHDVLLRKGQISEMTYGEGARAETWKTSDGFQWVRQSDGKVWHGFSSVDRKTGTVRDASSSGETTESKLDGTKETKEKADISGAAEAVRGTLDYWKNSNKIEDIRNQLKDMSAEQIYMVRHAFNPDNHNDLYWKLKESFDGVFGPDTHRWMEAEAYLHRRGQPGEKSAAQLAVDAEELGRWWWNRDRSKDQILSSTRNVLGPATQQNLDDMNAAFKSMYHRELREFYGKDGEGHAVRTWDRYHEKLMEVVVDNGKGKDKRTVGEQADIMLAALQGPPHKRLDYFVEAAGKGFATDKGRVEFGKNGGSQAIKDAFTETRATEHGSTYTVTDSFAVQQATDFADRGELRGYTQLRKATGVFSNDEASVRQSFEKLTPEERAQVFDGKRIAESGKQPRTEAEVAAVGEYKKWESAIQGLHYTYKDRKQTGYEDQLFHSGGTDVADKIAPIGRHWTNSHQVNLGALETMSRQTFDQLMSGVRISQAEGGSVTAPDGSRYYSEFHRQMSEAMQKNLGSGEYLDRAQNLLNDKVKFANEINKLADDNNLPALRNKVPAFANIPQAEWNELVAGHGLARSIADGKIKEGDLTPDQARQLQSYQADAKVLRPFLEGREVARQLNDIESGARLERLAAGHDLDKSIKDGKVLESTLTRQQEQLLEFYRKNAKEFEQLNPNLVQSSVLQQRNDFVNQLGSDGEKSLNAYRQTLYDATHQTIRRDLQIAIKDNEGTWRHDRHAMLDAIINMKPEERKRVRDDSEYRDALKKDVMAVLSGGEDQDPRWKAAEGLFKQIENDKKDKPFPDAPRMTVTEELYAKTGIDGIGRHQAVRLINDALKGDAKLAESLIKDPAFKEAATRAVGGDKGYETYVKPMLESGRLSVATLREMNTRLERTGGKEGTTREVFDAKGFLKDAVLDATKKGLDHLNSREGSAERDQLLKALAGSPQQRTLAEEIIKQGQVRPEDRLRAFYLEAGVSKDEVHTLLASMNEAQRMETVVAYHDKYGGNLRKDILEKVEHKEQDQFVRLTRGKEWDLETAYLHASQSVFKADAGMGGVIGRTYNVMHLEALAKFAEARFDAQVKGLPLPAEKQDRILREVESATQAFRESRDSAIDTGVTAIITTGSIVAAPFTAGTSLTGLLATGSVIASGGILGAGTKYALLGNDHEGFRALAGDFVKYSAMTAGNVLGPNHLLAATRLGVRAGTNAAETALAKAAFSGLTNEAKDEIRKGMVTLVREGLESGGGVSNQAITEMVAGVKGLNATVRTDLAQALQTSLSSSVKAEVEGTLKQVLHVARLQGQSVGLQGLAGAGGAFVGEAGRQLVDESKLSAEQLQLATIQGAAFAVPAAGIFKLGGYGWRKAFGHGDVHAPATDARPTPSASGHTEIPVTPERPRVPASGAPVERLSIETTPPVRERPSVAPEQPAVGKTVSEGLKAHENFVVIGEHGTRADIQGQRQLGKDLVAQLKESGATHLALELPRNAQGDLDAFMKGTMNIDQLKGRLPEEYRGQAFLDMLEAARKANKPDSPFALVAVGDGKLAGTNLPLKPEAYMRDTAEQLGRLLETNPNAKVVLWGSAQQADLFAREPFGVPREILPQGRALRQAIEQSAEGRFKPMSSETATAGEVAAMRPLGLDALQVGRLKAELNQGLPPVEMTAEAMRNNRVLGIGEMHREVNPHRNLFAADIIPELKRNGATHFAVEIPATEVNQRALDQFMNGQMTRQELRDILGHRLGGKAMQDSYLDVLDSARAHGLKLVAVDHVDQATTGLVGQRDQFMARKIGAILDADPNNKVVFWVGGEHLKRTPAGEPASAAQILRDKYSVSTVIEQSPTMQDATLRRVAGDLTEPVAVRTAGNQAVEGLPVQHFDHKLPPGGRANLGDYDHVIVYPDAAARPAAAELPAAARLDTDIRAGRLYKPEIPPPTDAELAALNQRIPELSKTVAGDFSARVAKVRDSWKENLSPALKRQQELAPDVKNAHVRLDSEIASLRSQNVKPADIEAAKLDKNHRLNQRSDLYNKHHEWQKLSGEHAELTRQIDVEARARQTQLQQELDRFAKDHKLPPVELKMADNMHAAGGYEFGKGIITVPKADLVGAGGKAGLSRNVFHELVHLEQDQLLVRNSIHATAAEGKPMDVKAVRDHYQAATGRDLDPDFLKNVVARSEGKPPLSPDDIARANELAMAVKDVRRPVAEESADLGNSARVMLGKLENLRANTDGQAVNRLFKQLFDEPGGDNLARRLFGEGAVPLDVVQQVRKWDNLPRDPATGLRVGFDGEEARQLLTRHLDQRLDQVNNQHKVLIDGYAGSRIEKEAYGLDSQVKELAGTAPQVSRLVTTPDPAAQPAPRQTLEESMDMRRNRIMELERTQRPSAEKVRELDGLRQQHVDELQRASRELRTIDKTLEKLEGLQQSRARTAAEEELYKTSMNSRNELKEVLKQERDGQIRRLIDQSPQAGDKGGYAGRTGRGGDDTQNLIFNQLQKEMKTPMDALRGRTPEEAGFIIVPMKAGSAIDSIGGDYLLINKNTGEFIPIDASQRVKSDLPKLRQDNVITSNPNDPRHGEPGTPSWDHSRRREINQQFEGIIARFKKEGSPLNVLDTPVPAAEPAYVSTRYDSRLAIIKDDARIRSLPDKERLAALDGIQDPVRRQDLIREWKHEAQQKQKGLDRLTRDMDEFARELRKSGDANDMTRARALEEFSKHTKGSSQTYLRRLINNDLTPREGRAELQILNTHPAQPRDGRQPEAVPPQGRRRPAAVERLDDEVDPSGAVPPGGDKPASPDKPG